VFHFRCEIFGEEDKAFSCVFDLKSGLMMLGMHGLKIVKCMAKLLVLVPEVLGDGKA
jgi:hypothetical protein